MTKTFVKWVGNKSQLAYKIEKLIPSHVNYYEPFVGSGVVFFHKRRSRATLVDSNAELMLTYQVVRDHPDELYSSLKNHPMNDKEYYLNIRGWDREPDFTERSIVDRASRFIYLCKASFNGLYRVNQKGQHNTPFGGDRLLDFDWDIIEACSKALQDTTLLTGDYQVIESKIQRGDFIYLDPPYHKLDKNSFVGYTANTFEALNQLDLKEFCDRVSERGGKFILSQSDSTEMRELFNSYKIHTVSVQRRVAASADNRGKTTELLIRNYE
jgi:DNA adenine methylase